MSDHELVDYIAKTASLGVNGIYKVGSFARAFSRRMQAARFAAIRRIASDRRHV